MGTWTLPSPRLLVERLSGRFWVWLDREEFLVPKNVLDIVEGQTVTWMGLFYCPLLPLLNSVFIFLTFYIKKVRARAGLGWQGVGVGAQLCGHLERHQPSSLASCCCPACPFWGVHLTPHAVAPPVHPAEELQGLRSAIPSL